jgi:hypothetical protein
MSQQLWVFSQYKLARISHGQVKCGHQLLRSEYTDADFCILVDLTWAVAWVDGEGRKG